MDDDLEPLVNDEIEKARIEMKYEDDILQNMLVKISIKQMELNQPDQPPVRIGITQYETWFKDTKTIPDDPPIKSEMNTNKIMSTTAFEKLNTISDTIPNLINQILSLALGISNIVVTKITEWSTEISNDDLSRLIDTINELI